MYQRRLSELSTPLPPDGSSATGAIAAGDAPGIFRQRGQLSSSDDVSGSAFPATACSRALGTPSPRRPVLRARTCSNLDVHSPTYRTPPCIPAAGLEAMPSAITGRLVKPTSTRWALVHVPGLHLPL